MAHIIRHYIVVILAFFTLTIHATEPFLITDSLEEFYIDVPYIEIYEDKSQKQRFEEIRKHPEWFRNMDPDKEFPHVQHSKTATWLHFTLKNTSRRDNDWVLENLDAHIDKFEMFTVQGDEQTTYGKAGYLQDFDERPYQHKNFVFPLDLETNETIEVYIRAVSSDENPFIFLVRTNAKIINYATDEYYLLGMFYGIMVIMAMIGLVSFILFKQRLYLFYFLYVLSAGLITLVDDGLGFQYLWNELPVVNTFVPRAAPILFFLTFYFYSRNFLSLNKIVPKIDKVLAIVTAIVVTVNTTMAFFVATKWALGFFLPYAIIYFAAIITLKKGYKAARYFILGYSFVFLGVIYQLLRFTKLIPWENLFTVYSLNFGLVLEVFILTIALGDRIRIIINDREKARQEREQAQREAIKQMKVNEELQEKVNRELEEKVAERTQELKEKNEALEKMTEEVNRMNLLLDQDNRSLKSDIQDLLKKRVTLKKVNLDEFRKLFPNTDSCYRYIADLKWKDGFTCKKCGEHEYKAGQTPFSRMCTSCNYTESITAHTLFENIKFSIEKAFYIIFLTFVTDKKISSYELERQVDLRQKTCWKFKSKVVTIMERKEKKMKAGEEMDWDDIISTNGA